MRLLDLFCGAGGCARGYHDAGLADEIVGVDINPQPNYPFTFIQADAVTFDVTGFDFIHASPPCQGYSVLRHTTGGKEYPMLVEDIRAKLRAAGGPYVIENVVGAPLLNPTLLCGLMFDIQVIRHRLFETSFQLDAPYHPSHRDTFTHERHKYCSFANGATHITVAGNNFKREDAAVAMEIDWMERKHELAQAIPPAYTEWIGCRFLKKLPPWYTKRGLFV
jgi:DNA (cytosine-5)-methyltransferase 1